MTDAILEVAAYVCLGLGVALLIARAFGERIKKSAGILRFRHSLRKLDGVPAEWTRAMDAMDDLRDDEHVRRNRRHQHPSSPDER
ncbi:MAG TPA: hypothetical protein VF244_03305 [Acidimicrobiales bacterium]